MRQQDLLVFDQAGLALEETLRMAIRDSLDADLLNRTDKGLLQFGADPGAPAAKFTFADYISAMYGAVDGVYAVEAGPVRMVVGATILAHMGASYVTGSNMSAAEKFAQRRLPGVQPRLGLLPPKHTLPAAATLSRSVALCDRPTPIVLIAITDMALASCHRCSGQHHPSHPVCIHCGMTSDHRRCLPTAAEVARVDWRDDPSAALQQKIEDGQVDTHLDRFLAESRLTG